MTLKHLSCSEYTHLLASGQLAEADASTRWSGRLHRWMCRDCAAFTHNDARLSGVLNAYREHVLRPETPEPRRPDDRTA